MELTRATRYAIAAVSHIAQQRTDKPVPSHVIAEARGIPERFLLKVLKPLVSVGILHSLKGPNGGYLLARPANRITVLEIVEVINGPIRGSQLKAHNGMATKLDRVVDDLCQRSADQVRRMFQRVRVGDLAKKG